MARDALMSPKLLGFSYRVLVAVFVISPIIRLLIPVDTSSVLSRLLIMALALFISHFFFSKIVKDNRGQLLGVFYKK